MKSLGASSLRQPSIPLSVLKSFLKSTDLCKGKVRGRAEVAGGQKGLSLVFPNPSLPKAKLVFQNFEIKPDFKINANISQ